MKKNSKSGKKTKSMSVKSMPKLKKSEEKVVSAVIKYIQDNILVDVDDSKDIIENLESKKFELFQSISQNLPKKPQDTYPLKRVKDPDAPKRGKSSYIFFCVDKRDSIKKKNPDMGAKEIIKELGRVWREDISDKERAKYDKMSKDDKVRYQGEMKDYSPPDLGFVKPKKIKRVGPKRGLTAYIFFCKENREVIKQENPEMSTKEITAELGKKWKSLSEKQKSPFVKLSEKDKLRYEKEKKEFNPVEEEETKQQSKKVKKTTKKKTGYILFCKEERDNVKELNPDLSGKEVTKELSNAWKELGEEEQGEYNERALE